MELAKIVKNPNITLTFIEQHFEKDWDWKELSKNPNINKEIVNRFSTCNWNWEVLVERKLVDHDKVTITDKFLIYKIITDLDISLKNIEKYISMDVNDKYIDLSANKNLTLNFVRKYQKFSRIMIN